MSTLPIIIIISIGIVDLPAIMKQLSTSDIIVDVQRSLEYIRDLRQHRLQARAYLPPSAVDKPLLQEILFDSEFMIIFHGTPVDLINEFIKQWITKHQNPTWEALVDDIRAIGASSAAEKIKAITPTTKPPASEQTALKKND